ncbi:MAG: LptF/LptG family permease [Phycisphaerae bacterium]|jgi:lipopolysaccharide export LptBFGC system permease protein LptF
MRTLDRYIVRSFLYSALLWLVVLMSLRIVVDLFVNLDEFAEKSQTAWVVIRHICTYYGYQSLTYLAQLGGVIIVASATFTLAMMGHTNELTAMLASGVSLHRVIWPIVICAMLMSGLIVLDQELVIPPLAPKLVVSRDDVDGKRPYRMPFITDGGGAVWRADTYTKRDSKMSRPVVFIRDEDFRQVATIFAAEASPGQCAGLQGWFFSGEAVLLRADQKDRVWAHVPSANEIVTSIEPDALALSAGANGAVKMEDSAYPMLLEARAFVPAGTLGKDQSARLEQPRFTFFGDAGAGGQNILGVFTADAAIWQNSSGAWQLVGGRLFYPTDLTAQDLVLRQSSHYLEYMSSSQLGDLLDLKRVPDPDSARLAKYIRLSEPFNNLVMLLLALPFILSRERRDIKASASLCLLMVGAFYAFIYLARSVGLPPPLGATLPVLLFGPVSVVMLDSIKT